MYYINIDVAKNSHCCSVTSRNGEVCVKPFYFNNNENGFNEFYDSIKSYVNIDCIAGLESTGHYGDNLINFILSKDIKCAMINPIITTGHRKHKIRKSKNDSLDTELIAKALVDKDYTLITKTSMEIKSLKRLTRLYHEKVTCISTIKTKIQKQIDLVFPEYNTIFKTKYSRAYLAVLRAFPTANDIREAHLAHLKNVIDKASSSKINKDYAKRLKDLSKISIGQDDETLRFELKALLSDYEYYNEQLDMIKEKIEDLVANSKSPIFSIPGIGNISGLSILSEIGDINNFDNPSKLIAYAGCDPGVIQSGNFQAPHTSISKRGSSYLRKTLYQVALTVVNNISTFREYYTLKISQGKSHRCAQGHVVRKLLRVIYTLLTNNISFDLELCK